MQVPSRLDAPLLPALLATTRDTRSLRAGFKRSAPAWSVQVGGGAVVIVALTSPA
jgi:hypothetical protein